MSYCRQLRHLCVADQSLSRKGLITRAAAKGVVFNSLEVLVLPLDWLDCKDLAQVAPVNSFFFFCRYKSYNFASNGRNYQKIFIITFANSTRKHATHANLQPFLIFVFVLWGCVGIIFKKRCCVNSGCVASSWASKASPRYISTDLDHCRSCVSRVSLPSMLRVR